MSKPLGPQEQRALCMAAKAGDVKSRDALVATNLPFVLRLARRLGPMGGGGLDMDDLVTEGALGLLVAIDRFDEASPVVFMTYAGWWVRQHMMRAIQNGGSTVRIPVHVQDARQRVRRAQRQLWLQGNPQPTPEQIAERCVARAGKPLSVKQVRSILGLGATISLDAPLGDSEMDGHDVLPAGELWADDRLSRAQLRKRVRDKCDAVKPSLDARETMLLEQRLLCEPADEMTLAEIGAGFALSRERIRQIEADLVERLRGRLKDEWDEYQGLRRLGVRRAPSVLKATLRAIAKAPRRAPGPLRPSDPSSRGAYASAVVHALSTMGWSKSVLGRHVAVVAQGFEGQWEPIQCALRINRIESESRSQRPRQRKAGRA